MWWITQVDYTGHSTALLVAYLKIKKVFKTQKHCSLFFVYSCYLLRMFTFSNMSTLKVFWMNYDLPVNNLKSIDQNGQLLQVYWMFGNEQKRSDWWFLLLHSHYGQFFPLYLMNPSWKICLWSFVVKETIHGRMILFYFVSYFPLLGEWGWTESLLCLSNLPSLPPSSSAPRPLWSLRVVFYHALIKCSS